VSAYLVAVLSSSLSSSGSWYISVDKITRLLAGRQKKRGLSLGRVQLQFFMSGSSLKVRAILLLLLLPVITIIINAVISFKDSDIFS
jgi:hypothetical protein